MEQRLQSEFLRPGPLERATALGVGAVAIGMGILLAAWGISFLLRYTPTEMAVRIANPEVRVTQNGPLTVTQDRPFTLALPGPLKIAPPEFTLKTEQPFPPILSGVSENTKTTAGDVITREVTVFSKVTHGPGVVVTGWRYRDGSGGVPINQYCYYSAANADRSTKRVDLATDGTRSSDFVAWLVPELEVALGKCQWWQG